MGIAAQNGLRKCEPMSRYYNDELYHFGIKHRSGRYKWGSGDRPYQGEGGVKSHIKAHATPDIPQGKGKANKSAYEVTTDKISKAADSASNTLSSFRNLRSNARDTQLAIKASKMSDDELRRVIQRKNLEQQYVNVMHDPATERGFDTAKSVLNTVGSVATVAGAVFGAYSAFHHIKEKAGD